jgi:hypothetical protein
MHTTNYVATLILPSDDCPAPAAMVPARPGSVAALQFDRLQAAPHGMTSDDLIWSVTCDRRGSAADDPAARADFYSKGQACLRASPLVKTHGWAIHHDELARVALVDPGTAAFLALMADPGTTKVKGMRNARA